MGIADKRLFGRVQFSEHPTREWLRPCRTGRRLARPQLEQRRADSVRSREALLVAWTTFALCVPDRVALDSLAMGGFYLLGLAVTSVGLVALGCGSSGSAGGNSAQPGLTGTAFGQPFAARDTLLIHPQTWKSADSGSTAILISDTPNLCVQITSRKMSAPGRLVIVSLQENGADGSVVDLDVGQFVTTGQGTPSSRYGEVFLSEVNAQCGFGKLFSDQSSIQITSVGPQSTPVSVSIDVHFTSGDALQGSISASVGCDEAAVDKYLNGNPTCG